MLNVYLDVKEEVFSNSSSEESEEEIFTSRIDYFQKNSDIAVNFDLYKHNSLIIQVHSTNIV